MKGFIESSVFIVTTCLALSSCSSPAPALPDGALPLAKAGAVIDLSSNLVTKVKVPAGDYTLAAPAWVTAEVATVGNWTYLSWIPDALAALPASANVPTVSSSFTLSSSQATYQGTLKLSLNKVTGHVNAGGALVMAAAPLPNVPGGDKQAGEITRLLVQRRSTISAQSLQALGLTEVTTLQLGAAQWQVVEGPDAEAKAAQLRSDPSVVRVIRDVRLHAQAAFTPGDPLASEQWQLPLLGYAEVLADHPERYPNRVTVAVLDSGVKYSHPDLAGRLLSGEGAADFIANPSNGDGDGVDNDPEDPVSAGSHGTAVTGLIVANQNSIGIAGGTLNAPVKVLPIRVLDSAQNGVISEIMLGLRYAAGEEVKYGGVAFNNPHPAQVINVSLGEGGQALSSDERNFICEAVSAASSKGALVVAASGNSGVNDVMYPAACPGALAVASVTLTPQQAFTHAPYSAYGPSVALSAPGGWKASRYNGNALNGAPLTDGVLSTDWQVQATYAQQEGTSFATPQVSAAAALLLAKGVTRDAAATRAQLISTATDVDAPGRDDQTGAGVLNVARALGLAVAPTPPAAPSAEGLLLTVTAGKRALTPPVGSSGDWAAYLPAGTYAVASGVDKNGNQVLDPSEVVSSASLTVGAGGITVK